VSSLPKPSVVLFVTNVPRMTHFDQSVVAMDLVLAEADHAVLELAGLQLIIHALRGEPAVARAPVGASPYARTRTSSCACPWRASPPRGALLQSSAVRFARPRRSGRPGDFVRATGTIQRANVWQVRENAA
jgi:hypothetical protein